MARAEFSIRIERLLHLEGRTYVVPSSLPIPTPSLHVGMTLSGVPIDPWFSEVQVNGKGRPAFVISPHARPHTLQAGQVVTLEDGRWNARRVLRELRRVRQLEWHVSIRKAVRAGARIAWRYSLLAVSGLIWAFLNDVDVSELGGVSPSFFFSAAILLYFTLALMLGTVVGFLLPFVRDRDIAMLVGGFAGSLALLSFVPLVALVKPESRDVLTVACATVGGAVIGGWVALDIWDDTQDRPRGPEGP